MTFWCAGFRNVTAAYGVNGLTEIIWRRSEAWRRARADRLRPRRGRRGGARRRSPKQLMPRRGSPASGYLPQGHGRQRLCAQGDAGNEVLGPVMRKAEWLGNGQGQGGKRPEPTSARTELDAALAQPRRTGARSGQEPSFLAAEPDLADIVSDADARRRCPVPSALQAGRDTT